MRVDRPIERTSARGRGNARAAAVATGCIACLLAATLPSTAGVALVEPSDGRWIGRDQPVVLRIDEAPSASEGRLAIFIGRNDVTDLCTPQPPGDLRCSPALLPLPEGEQQIAVYLVKTPTEWTEIGSLPLRVLTRSGWEVSEVTPRVGLAQVGEIGRGGSAEALPPGDDPSAVTGQGGISTRWRRSGWELRSAWNVVAASDKPRALRYGTLGEEAPMADLSDYLIELEHGGTQFALGHVSFGDQPLLLNGLSHRGLRLRQKIGDRIDLGITAQSGQMTSGYSNILGIDGDNYIAGASAGFELLANRPGGLRLGLMYTRGETRSDLDFNTGQVPDAQDNRGYGVRLSGSIPGDRLRGSLEFASSRYTNPGDPLLSQGLDLVPVTEDTSTARDLNLALDLVQERQIGASTFASVTLGFRHLRLDPLYRTMGAWVTGDQQSHTGMLDATIGLFSLQALHVDSEDNLDEVPTILKTNTHFTTLSYSLPLKSLFPAAKGEARSWLPDAFYQNCSRMHQEGRNRPPGFDPGTHIPDQVTRSVTTGLNWSFWRATLGYELTLSDLDNRQPARARADFKDVTHGVSVGLQAGPTLRLGLGLNAVSVDNRELAVRQNTDGYNFDLDWQVIPSVGLRGSYGWTQGNDTRRLSDNRNWTTLTELNYRLPAPALRSRTLSVQLYLRHVAFGNEMTDRTIAFSSHTRTWSVSGGLNVGFF